MELLTKLGIDWKLLVAQIVNFFILLVVLYKFVYNPVLNMLDRRSKVIEKGITDAKLSEERLAQIQKMQDEKMAATSREIGALLEQAKVDAEMVKKDLIATASLQAEDLLRRAKVQNAEEKEKMLYEVKREVASFIVDAASKILEREFSHADQKRLAEAVTREMQSK
jgi:F-type H+-transporting ATPase subunit b